MKRLALAFTISLFCAAPAGAAIVYDNTTEGSDAGDTFADQGPILGNSFSVTEAFKFTELKLLLLPKLELDNGDLVPVNDGKSIKVDLYNGDENGPSSPHDPLFTIFDNDLNTSESLVDRILDTPIDLDIGRYWIVLSTTDGSSASWSVHFDAAGTNVSGEFFYTLSSAKSNDEGPHQMAVIGTSGTPGSSVPEPLTLSLFGAGLIGAAGLRRRKKSG